MELLKAYCKDFWRYRYLLYNLIGRDFKLKYRRSVLGVVWSVLNPLLMNVVMVVVFSTILDMRSGGIEQLFRFTSSSASCCSAFSTRPPAAAMGSVLGAATLLQKGVHPQIHLPAGKGVLCLVNCLFSFIALIIVMIFTGRRCTSRCFWRFTRC